MNDDDINLEQFLTEARESLDRFGKDWCAQNQKTPKDWPMKMSRQDWYEQLMMWTEVDD